MASTSVVLPWSTCAIMAMLRSFEFIVSRFVMSMRPDEQGCKRYLATPIELREVSGATNASLFYHAAPNSAPFSGVWEPGNTRLALCVEVRAPSVILPLAGFFFGTNAGGVPQVSPARKGWEKLPKGISAVGAAPNQRQISDQIESRVFSTGRETLRRNSSFCGARADSECNERPREH